jgi:hypothetical protein
MMYVQLQTEIEQDFHLYNNCKNTVKPEYTTTLGTQNLWSLLTGGRYSEGTLGYKSSKWDLNKLVTIRRRSGLTVFKHTKRNKLRITSM